MPNRFNSFDRIKKLIELSSGFSQVSQVSFVSNVEWLCFGCGDPDEQVDNVDKQGGFKKKRKRKKGHPQVKGHD